MNERVKHEDADGQDRPPSRDGSRASGSRHYRAHPGELTRCVGDAIRRVRVARNMTQAELAKLVGVDARTVGRAERRGVLKIEMLKLYATALGTKAWDLLETAESHLRTP